MTIVAVFCSQIIRQKSFTVSSFGPGREITTDTNTQRTSQTVTKGGSLFAKSSRTLFTLSCNKLVLFLVTLKYTATKSSQNKMTLEEL